MKKSEIVQFIAINQILIELNEIIEHSEEMKEYMPDNEEDIKEIVGHIANIMDFQKDKVEKFLKDNKIEDD